MKLSEDLLHCINVSGQFRVLINNPDTWHHVGSLTCCLTKFCKAVNISIVITDVLTLSLTLGRQKIGGGQLEDGSWVKSVGQLSQFLRNAQDSLETIETSKQ